MCIYIYIDICIYTYIKKYTCSGGGPPPARQLEAAETRQLQAAQRCRARVQHQFVLHTYPSHL